MAGRRTNLALLALLPVAVVSGMVVYALGTPAGRMIVVAHGLVGFAIVLLSPWKAAIARRGVRRRTRGRTASVLLGVLVVVTVASGLAHAAGLRDLPLVATTMHLHVGAALTALPLALWHVVARPVRPRPSDASRRAMVRSGALLLGAGVLWAGTETTWRLARLPGATRRFTGSHEVGTDAPAAMPVIQWLTDRVQHLDAGSWRVAVQTAGRPPQVLRLADLEVQAETVRAVIDCTSGWYAAQDWHGVRLDHLVGAADGARSVVVTSVTGYRRRFPVADLSRLWLATGYAGMPLSAAHGAPARLVAPGRRGFWWVKWVTDVRLDDTPWWRQAPFPLR